MSTRSMGAFMKRLTLLAAPALTSASASSFLPRTTQTQARCADSFHWADNSQGYSPCFMTAVVWGSCFTGNWNVPALTEGNQYSLPDSESVNKTANLCTCSWAAYNLISACTACQGFDTSVPNWAAYIQSCQTPQNLLTDSVVVVRA
ncbi:hypothetical protein MKEN_00270700 [Mycena kentingensis (nom. inval.)]|nr:hypothetical protein MKEN_00270700 [Mycena kentingensis (nom. inval.)]